MKDDHKDTEPQSNDCTSASCDWGYIEDADSNQPMLGCVTGTGDCQPFTQLLEADVSPFHDSDLQLATAQINSILSGIEPRDGYNMALVFAQISSGVDGAKVRGPLLGWVQQHGAADGEKMPVDKMITNKNSPEEIARALRLKKR